MDDIDLSAVAQIAETGQLRAIAAAMILPSSHRWAAPSEILDGGMMADIEAKLDLLTPFLQGI